MLAPTVAALSLLAPAALAGGQVWVVDDDGGPGVDFTSLQAAATAAQNGDLLLVRSGVYEPFTTQGKGLSVCADAGALVELRCASSPCASYEIKSTMLSDQRLVLRGLKRWPGTLAAPNTARFDLVTNAGLLWVEDCSFNRIAPATFHSTLVRTQVLPPSTGPATGYGNAAVNFSGGAQIFECDVRAPLSPATSGGVGGNSATAGVFVGGYLHVVRSTVHGGDGFGCKAITSPTPQCVGVNGGPGIWQTTEMTLLAASDVRGGKGSLGGASCVFPATTCGTGTDGPAATAEPGYLGVLPHDAGTLEIESPVRVGQAATLTIRGTPGDAVLVYFSPVLAQTHFKHYGGMVVWNSLGSGLQVMALGALGPSGTLQVDVPIAALPSQAEFAELFLQAVFLSPQQQIKLGTASVLHMLDASY